MTYELDDNDWMEIVQCVNDTLKNIRDIKANKDLRKWHNIASLEVREENLLTIKRKLAAQHVDTAMGDTLHQLRTGWGDRT